MISKNKSVIKYGLISNTLFGIFMRGLGDSIQQKIELSYKRKLASQDTCKKPDQIDLNYSWKRTLNISSTGIIIGPLNQVWYWFLDKQFPQKTFKSVCKKIILDQLIGATFFTFLFIIIICLLDGFSLRESLREFVVKFPFIYMIDWLIWPPSQALNFMFVPQVLRVVFVNIILFCWNIFLSFAKYNDVPIKIVE